MLKYDSKKWLKVSKIKYLGSRKKECWLIAYTQKNVSTGLFWLSPAKKTLH